MDETLEQYADTVKDREFEELFPDTAVDKARNNEEKVKEALFQVHYMLYNKDLYEKVHGENSPESSDYHISKTEIAECLTEEEFARLKKQMGAVTVIEEDGEILIPKVDVQDILSPRKGVID